MSERIVPASTFKERTDGLIGVPALGAINLLLIGTASKGTSEPVFFDSSGVSVLGDYKNVFGPVDPYSYSTASGTNPPAELTLPRSLDIIYQKANGAFGGVWACRAVESGAIAMISDALDSSTTFSRVRATAVENGSWYNNWQYSYTQGEDKNYNIGVNYKGLLRFWKPSEEVIDSFVTDATTRESAFQWYNTGTAPIGNGSIQVECTDISATTYPRLIDVHDALANSEMTKYFDFSLSTEGSGADTDVMDNSATVGQFSEDTGGTNWSSDDSSEISNSGISDALAKLETKSGRFLLISGSNEGDSGVQNLGLNHVINASQNDRERIFITGLDNYSTLAAHMTAAAATPYPFENERVFTMPIGLEFINEFSGRLYGDSGAPADYSVNSDDNSIVKVSGAYVAAWYIRTYASIAPAGSMLGKVVNYVPEWEFTKANLETLINDGHTPVGDGFNSGYIVKRAITSTSDGHPFRQQSTRVIVDHVRYGLRPIALAFLGKPNNGSTRATMERLFRLFLQELVNNTVITNYDVDVSATRDQEIIGVVKAKILVSPIFFIEFIEFDLIVQ